MSRPVFGAEWARPGPPVVGFVKVAVCPACRSLLTARADLGGLAFEWDVDDDPPPCPPSEHRRLEEEARAEWLSYQPIRTGGDN